MTEPDPNTAPLHELRQFISTYCFDTDQDARIFFALLARAERLESDRESLQVDLLVALNALKAIEQHIQITAPALAPLSTVRHIAKAAVHKIERPKPEQK